MTATNNADDPEPVRLDPVDLEIDARDTPDEAPTSEMRWAYGGVRVLGGKKVHALVEGRPATGSPASTVCARPGWSSARSTASPSATNGATPACAASPATTATAASRPELAAQWRVHHEAAQAALALARQHRHAARRDELDEALEPLRVIAATLRTSADRTAFAAYVLTEITSAWTRPRSSTKD
jgi:hypothetical protein